MVEDAVGRILLMRRTDTGNWSVPGGAVEEGDTFATAAVHELREETRLQAEENDLIPFACLSDPRWMRVRFPNGDAVQSFNVCFLLRRWSGEPAHDGRESSEVGFFEAAGLPTPLLPFVRRVLELRRSFAETGAFQSS